MIFIRRNRSIFAGLVKALRKFTMPALPEKDQQILVAHAGLVHAVVRTCHNRDLMPQLEQLLKLSEENGWTQLVATIRRILGGQRDTSLLLGLDEEDRAIAEAILRGLQNPETLPDLNATDLDAAKLSGRGAQVSLLNTNNGFGGECQGGVLV